MKKTKEKRQVENIGGRAKERHEMEIVRQERRAMTKEKRVVVLVTAERKQMRGERNKKKGPD